MAEKNLDLFNSVFEKNVTVEEIEQLVRGQMSASDGLFIKASLYAIADLLTKKLGITETEMLESIQANTELLVKAEVDRTIDSLNNKAMAEIMKEEVDPKSIC